MATVVIGDPSIPRHARWRRQREGFGQSLCGTFCRTMCECMAFLFEADNYWSSSQNNTTNAWKQNFNNGNVNNNTKTNLNRVRAVR